MALISCPHCGKAVSDTAEKCPHCGFDFEKDREREDRKQRYDLLSYTERKKYEEEFALIDSSYNRYKKFEKKEICFLSWARC